LAEWGQGDSAPKGSFDEGMRCLAGLVCRPLYLKLNLFLAVAALVLDIEGRSDRHGNPLACDFYFKTLTALQRIGKAAQLFNELG
jgi:hypothetical protein